MPQSVDVAWPQPHLTKQPWFIIWPMQLVSLGTERWIEHATCLMRRNLLESQTATHLGDRSSPTWGVTSFPSRLPSKSPCREPGWPPSSSAGHFSFRRALSPLAISGCLPPYFAANGHKSVPRSQSDCNLSELSSPCQSPHLLYTTRRSSGPHDDVSVPSERVLSGPEARGKDSLAATGPSLGEDVSMKNSGAPGVLDVTCVFKSSASRWSTY